MSQAEAGKGSAPRKNRDDLAYAEGWERIFATKRKQEQKQTTDVPVRTAPFGQERKRT